MGNAKIRGEQRNWHHDGESKQTLSVQNNNV